MIIKIACDLSLGSSGLTADRRPFVRVQTETGSRFQDRRHVVQNLFLGKSNT